MRSVNLRKRLYQDSGLNVLYDPIQANEESGVPDIIDLTWDVSNTLQISHKKTDEARALLNQAKIVVCDNPVLADAVRRYAKLTTQIHYGYLYAAHTRKQSDPVRFGLLHHDDLHQFANLSAYEDVLKPLGLDYIVYGEEDEYGLSFDDREVKYTTSLGDFIAQVDVVLLPAVPDSPISTSLPLALMGAGLAIIATKTASLYPISRPTGYTTVEGGFEAWFKAVAAYTEDTRLLAGSQERNAAYALQKQAEATLYLQNLINRIRRQS